MSSDSSDQKLEQKQNPEPKAGPKGDPREGSGGPPIWSVGLAVAGGILLITFIAYAITIGDIEKLEAPWIAAGGVGILALGGWLYLERESLRRASATQGARFTGGALLLTAMALGIAVALNVVAHRYDDRIDLTSTGLFTLSQQTKDVVAGLQQPVEVLAFFPAGSAEEVEFRTLIEGYEALSEQLSVDFKDPVRNPLLVEQHQITSTWGTVILKQGEATQRLEDEFTEQEVTNALVRLTSGAVHTLCFVTGHEEPDTTDTYGATGLGAVVERLGTQNYAPRVVTLFREGRVPADCAALIAADPRQDWLPAELEMLAAYIAGGGHFFLMLEPGSAPALAAHMQRYGIDVGDNLVLEAGANAQLFGGDVSYILLEPTAFDFHPISEAVKGFTMHRVVRTVGKGADVAGIDVQELARTTPDSWAKTDLQNLTDLNPDPTKDRMGPLPILAVAEVTDPANIPVYAPPAAPAPGEDGRGGLTLPPAPEEAPAPEGGGEVPAPAGEEAAPAPAPDPAAEATPPAPTPAPTLTSLEVERKAGGRLAVYGDVDFAMNGMVGNKGNLDLFLNTIAWLVGEEDRITIRPNEAAEAGISMTIIQMLLVWLICLVVAPGAAVLGALSTWRSRR